MDQVRINRTELLNIIRKNREVHYDEYLTIKEAFREKVTSALKKRLSEIESSGIEEAFYLSLPAPTEHTKDYDRCIRMLELSADDIVEIDNETFAQIVMDDWSWKKAWTATNALYSSRPK